MKTAEVAITLSDGGGEIGGDFGRPEGAAGVVLFAHGSGSGRFSPRNRFVAERLGESGFATLLLDLLTSEEERHDRLTRQYRFDIPLLAERLLRAMAWLTANEGTAGLPLGLFGASTGAAAALLAASREPEVVRAVVSRGGRPDLAGKALADVRAPTLLVVGGEDGAVMELNRRAQRVLRSESRLEVVPGAGHLFEEPGALERVASLASDWFREHLPVAG